MSLLGVRMRIAVIAALLMFSSGITSRKATAADDELCDFAADLALKRADYPAAVMLHRWVLRLEPDNALAHYHLGFAYGMSGRAPEELSEYQTSARLGLRKWDLFLNLGLAYLDKGDLVRATEALETAVLLGPEHAEAHFNLAIVYEGEDRLDEALREIIAARRLAPEDSDAANTNAIICAETGDTAGAHDIWARLVQHASEYTPARVNLSILNRSIAADGQFFQHTQFSTERGE